VVAPAISKVLFAGQEKDGSGMETECPEKKRIRVNDIDLTSHYFEKGFFLKWERIVRDR
jgi:hypothetical protein